LGVGSLYISECHRNAFAANTLNAIGNQPAVRELLVNPETLALCAYVLKADAKARDPQQCGSQ
jgi:hypothetical protein